MFSFTFITLWSATTSLLSVTFLQHQQRNRHQHVIISPPVESISTPGGFMNHVHEVIWEEHVIKTCCLIIEKGAIKRSKDCENYL